MAKVEEDEMLTNLSEQIDMTLYKWMLQNKISGLNLTAIVLARLTWLAKQGDYKEDFIALLESPSKILKRDDEEKVMH
jgi:hypothetical protein